MPVKRLTDDTGNKYDIDVPDSEDEAEGEDAAELEREELLKDLEWLRRQRKAAESASRQTYRLTTGKKRRVVTQHANGR